METVRELEQRANKHWNYLIDVLDAAVPHDRGAIVTTELLYAVDMMRLIARRSQDPRRDILDLCNQMERLTSELTGVRI